jgi:predicted PurR-regulated permease PerM
VWTLAILATVAFLKLAASLVIPIVIAILLSYALEPPVLWLHARKLPRVAGATLVLFLLFGGLGLGAYRFGANAVAVVEVLPEAARRIRTTLESRLGWSRLDEAVDAVQGADSDSEQQKPGTPAPSSPGASVTVVAASIFALLGHLTVVVFLTFFLLVSGSRIGERIVEAAGPSQERRNVISGILRDVNSQIQRFLFVQLLTATVVAAATWAVLAWMDVANAAIWGLLAGVFNSVPYFGPVFVSGGLFLVGMVQSGDTGEAVRMALAALAITSLEGWVLTPPLMGRAQRMNVIAVFVGLLLWTWLWGAWGTLLAVPMLAATKSVADHIPRLRPLARLMAS